MPTLAPEHEKLVKLTQTDPVGFFRHVLGEHPHSAQQKMIRAMADPKVRRISVSGGNGTGKDWTTGRLVLWWMASHYPAKVIVSGPTGRQISDIVWNELRHAHRNSKIPLGGKLLPSAPRWQFNEEHFAIGLSTQDPWNLQGFHSPHLLVVVTEAHAMSVEDITALRRLNPEMFVMTGNPFSSSGEFYDAHHSMRGIYHAIELSALETPNFHPRAPWRGWPHLPGLVTKEQVKDRLDEWGEDSPLYIAGVLGQFPENLDDTIISLLVASAAAKRVSKPEPEEPFVLGLDVARFGRDKTVAMSRQGSHAELVWRVHGRDTMQIVGWVNNYIHECWQDEDTHDVDYLVVDANGIGAGVYDRLTELDLHDTVLVAFNAGEGATEPERFVNAGSEVWWRMREWYMGLNAYAGMEADIPPDNALIGQCSQRGYYYQSERRIMIEPKTKLEKSPDEADALAMTFAGTLSVPQIRWI